MGSNLRNIVAEAGCIPPASVGPRFGGIFHYKPNSASNVRGTIDMDESYCLCFPLRHGWKSVTRPSSRRDCLGSPGGQHGWGVARGHTAECPPDSGDG